MENEKQVILSVRDMVKYFPIKGGLLGRTVGHVKAVDKVSFDLYEGETLGLVGESGCGKSTLGRSILEIIEPTSGTVQYRGKDVLHLKGKEKKEIKQKMQFIFQDPAASLNPRRTLEQILLEPFIIHKMLTPEERRKRVAELLEIVGLSSYYIHRYPHELSGGQKQRIGIARAIALNPDVIICDEPVSALDVSIQAQVINLLEDLQKELHLSYLFVAHDLSVVQHISDRVAVMYLGKIVEISDCDNIYSRAKHPYTISLLSAIPIADPEVEKERIILEGDVPSPANPPKGCRFHTRCFKCMDICKSEEPELIEQEPGHFIACHLYPKGEN